MGREFKCGDWVVIPKTKEIKYVEEVEVYDGDAVVYTSDGCSYGVVQCQTVHQAYEAENRWVPELKSGGGMIDLLVSPN